ncbi:MAG TPA: monovalent cation:proton antiporter-2 (CPA2) family protein [Rhodocyclaceae bacterium]|nr:monovalent cation:proton antiporter-2 (CPA2) family protein [Rhodocyclaceae bacterium]
MDHLKEVVILLAVAVVAVPLSRRLGLGAVLGYLLAGMAVGPWGLRLIGNVDNIRSFAELGVIFLLFIIGLELQPSRLWVLRRWVFGLGSAQVAATTLVLAAFGWGALGLPMSAALVAGLGLSLSSTAFVLQLLAEKGQLTSRHGRSAFAVLLFQDLVVIPVLALMPLFAPGAQAHLDSGLVLRGLGVMAALAAVVAGGRYLLRPFFRLVAATGNQEVFAAAGLLVVIGTALLMEALGLSMSLGAFLAGVLLADSEYRHELEARIEPFEGLLLGLFFMSVGMGVNLGLLGESPFRLVGLAAALMAVKAAVLAGLGRLSGHRGASAASLGLYLSQGGEFAFVLFAVAVGDRLMDAALSEELIVVVTLSMALTPLLVAVGGWAMARWSRDERLPDFDALEDAEEPRVIIAGFGRFGQIVARILRLRKIRFTALEVNPTQVDFVRRYGNKIYYGDASRLDLLRAAKADRAAVFVLAIDDVETSVRTAEMVRRHFPHLAIYARARNRFHAYKLMDIGVTLLMRETYLSSLDLARSVLTGLGECEADAQAAVDMFRAHDEATLLAQHAVYRDEAQLVQTSKEAAKELEGLFEADAPGNGAGDGRRRKAP